MDQSKIRFLKGLSTALVVTTMVFAFLIAGIRIFGVQVYGVLTGSMEPAYPTGSLIYVKAVDASDLRVNDVITFSISPGVIATHRIVEIVPDEQSPTQVRYRTKGDANRDVDAALVSANNIIGKVVFAAPQLGYVANYIQQAPGIYVAILVCGLMIAFVFYTDSLDEKHKKQSRMRFAEEKPHADLVTAVNGFSQKIIGRKMIKTQAPPEPTFRQGYVPKRAAQQHPQPYGGMQQTSYPQYYQQYSPQGSAQVQGYYPPQGQYQMPYQRAYPLGQLSPSSQQIQSQQPFYPQQTYYGNQQNQFPMQNSAWDAQRRTKETGIEQR